MVTIARDYFLFISKCLQAIIEMTDGRRGLVAGRDGATLLYEYIMIDAYADDAMPTHLLTTEAFSVYLSRLSYDGIIAVHISLVP